MREFAEAKDAEMRMVLKLASGRFCPCWDVAARTQQQPMRQSQQQQCGNPKNTHVTYTAVVQYNVLEKLNFRDLLLFFTFNLSSMRLYLVAGSADRHKNYLVHSRAIQRM
jgi:hypothetical protein